MALVSAGLLVFRRRPGGPQFLLAHPGGPFWQGRDAGAWSIPKGLVEPGETLSAAAAREFAEETGLAAPAPQWALTPVRQAGGKTVHAFLAEADLDLGALSSNRFEMEWPRGSGRTAAFAEIDRAGYFAADEALVKILPGQAPLIRQAVRRLGRAQA